MTFASGATTVTFSGALWPFEFEPSRLQNFGVAADGTLRIYNKAVDSDFIRLTIDDDHDNLLNIRNFIRTTINYMMTAFTFTPDANIDVGNGDGGAVTVNLWQTNLNERQNSYHKYQYYIVLRIVP